MSIQRDRFNLLDYFLSDEKLEQTRSDQAIEFRGLRLSYKELRQVVDSCAKTLVSLNVKHGDRVAVLLYDSPEFIAYFLATVSLQAICVPINTFLQTSEIDFILADSKATVLITEEDLAEKISEQQQREGLSVVTLGKYPEAMQSLRAVQVSTTALTQESSISPDDTSAVSVKETPAFILYTSGSTGTPKGALHSHGNVEAIVKGFGSDVLKLQAADKVFSASRLFFAYGLGNSLSFPIAAGATVILENRRPTPQMIATIFTEQKPTVFSGVPAVYRALLDLHNSGEKFDTTSIRLCISAGEALPATLFEEWQQTFGIEILDGIGSTEMLHMFTSNRPGAAKAGSSGPLVKGYEAEILDDAGNQVPDGEQGNLWVKGASAMLGYWQRDDLTAAVMRNGWMRTGDVYRKDEQGYYYHIGRSDDCFKVKGLWVSPIEIESVLLSHPEVVEAAVIASTDENGLATAKAYLVIRQGSEETLEKELYEFTSARLALYKRPTQYEFVKEMPRTSTGKIQRFKLRV